MNVHLVDGTYELFRAYYGGPEATNDEGRDIGACRTLLRSLLFLLRDPEVTHVACAFDHVIESFRNDLFAGYKTGEGIGPVLYGQFDLAEEVSRALGIVTWPMIEFEADDAIATAAHLAAADARVERVLICSPDKDFAQCVEGERVILFDRMRQKQTDARGVVEKFGVPPASIPDYLALVGDTADGIPGIPGWGQKSAGAVLAAYGTIDAIPTSPATWSVKVRGASTLSANLEAGRPDAALYRKLATLRRDVPLGVTVDGLAWRGPDTAKLTALSPTLGDARLVASVTESLAQRPGR